MKFLSILIRASLIVWVVCIIAVIALLWIATNSFKGAVQETQLGNSDTFIFLFLGIAGLGIIAFGLLILSIAIKILTEKKALKFKKSLKGFLVFSFKILLIVAVFPLFLLYKTINIKSIIRNIKKDGFNFSLLKSLGLKSLAIRFITIIVIVLFLVPIWVSGYIVSGVLIKAALGYSSEPITISGTGSMYPTFPKGQGKTPKELSKEIVDTPGMFPYPNGILIGGNRLFGYQLTRGDIVVLINDKTKELSQKLYGEPSGWVKRIIGLPRDTIELKSGIVYLNGQPLKESYTAKARSTFGETFLSECKKVTIPTDSVFVMGDNRKGSGDSREIGFINIKDINHVLPIKNQKGTLDKNWRDTSNDLEESSKIKLDKQKYLDLLNEKRKEASAQPLKYQPKLENSASKRGEVILKYDDFSFEATRSAYTMAKAMSDSNYWNIVYGEAPQLGYYEAEELIENQFEFPETKKFLLNKDSQEIGISEVEGTLNGCPAQVIVQHFAGYVPPNYKAEDIESWKTNLSRLKEIQPSWFRLKDNTNFYQKNKADVDRINEIISIRIANMSAIVARMETNQWFTAAEQRMVNQDKALYNEQEAVATRLSSQ